METLSSAVRCKYNLFVQCGEVVRYLRRIAGSYAHYFYQALNVHLSPSRIGFIGVNRRAGHSKVNSGKRATRKAGIVYYRRSRCIANNQRQRCGVATSAIKNAIWSI